MAEADSDKAIALCLSGGGLRATLFHLGLIKALRAHQIDGVLALSRVTEIYSVSGGSIVAAHMIRNWSSYTGDTDEYAQVERELIEFSKRNIRDRVVRRWLLARWTGKRRSYWLQREYGKLVGQGAIRDCYLDQADNPPPPLYILATSFRTGELTSFGPKTFEITRRSIEGPKTIETAGGHLPLAFAVAASSAFPPLFPPVPLTPDMLGNPDGDEFQDTIQLSDGGVFDNLGFEKARINRNRALSPPGILIASNAGGSFRADSRNTFAGVLSRNIRASDILMRRVADGIEDSAAISTGVRYVPVRIGTSIDDGTIAPVTQLRLRLVRTDMDRFDTALSRLLIDHGARVGSSAFREQGWEPREALTSLADFEPVAELDRIAKAAARRSVRSFATDFRDWKTVPIFWGLAALLCLGSAMAINSIAEERRSKRQAEAAEQATRLAEGNKRAIARQIAPMRDAYSRQNYRRLGELLGIAAVNAEETEQDPGRNIAADPIKVTQSQASQIANRQIYIELPRRQLDHQQPIFIQFAGSLTRAQITALNQALRGAGWRAQGASGERLVQSAGLNEVRYAGANQAAAEELATIISGTGLPSKRVTARRFDIVGPKNLELWISR